MPRRVQTPADRERLAAAEQRSVVNGWWARFTAEGPWASMDARARALTQFASYVSRELLFCRALGPRRCSAITVEQVQRFFLEDAPHSITVDDPRGFVEHTMAWIRWLAGAGVLEHGKTIARGLSRGAWRKDALVSMQTAKGGPSKELVVQARDAGIDVGDPAAVLAYVVALRPGDTSWEAFCREFVDPPHPVFDRGRALYMPSWPPQP